MSSFHNADFGRGSIQLRTDAASKSAVLSLFLSLHKQRKEVHAQTKERRAFSTNKKMKYVQGKEGVTRLVRVWKTCDGKFVMVV